jgi:REP element-mobilizing transposase RayT
VPRKQRIEGEGFIHHVSGRGVDGEPIFTEDEDRVGYLAMLAATVLRFRWLCLAYCQMGTHVHLLIETPDANLGPGMRWLHGRYGACFNRQHARDGHLFQGRYHDEPILTEGHLVNAVGYIAANPVAAGLCKDPHDWPWGSHQRVMAGTAPLWIAHDHLVEHLEAISGSGDAYERIVEARARPSLLT